MLHRERGPECLDASAWPRKRTSTLFHDYWQAKEAKVLLSLDRCRDSVRRRAGIAHPAVCSGPETRWGFDYLQEACVPALRTHCGKTFVANGRKFMVTYADADECLAAERVLPPS